MKGVSAITESFDKFATLSKSGTADSNPDACMDHSGWTLHDAYRGDNGSSAESGETATSVRFGTGSLAGSATSPTLDLSGNNRFFLDNLEIVSGTAVSHTVLSGEEVEETSVAVNGLRPNSRCAFTVTAYAAKEGGEEVATAASALMRTPPAPPVTLFMMR